ncbi:MAG TPA: hypothetical protein VM536_05590 [Chloroflexia bacterium]|nr:hypothetical protein [Chloroflexia bacterium]
MDDQTKNTTTPTSGGTGGADPREELREQLQLMGKAAQDLLEQLVRVPATLAQIPLQVLPEDTATHARNAASEGFAAVRTLVDTMSRGVDDLMKAQRERMNSQRNAGMGSTGTSMSSTPDNDPAGATRSLDAGSGYIGGHGTGHGMSGSDHGADTGSHDLNGGNTIRLDEEP